MARPPSEDTVGRIARYALANAGSSWRVAEVAAAVGLAGNTVYQALVWMEAPPRRWVISTLRPGGTPGQRRGRVRVYRLTPDGLEALSLGGVPPEPGA